MLNIVIPDSKATIERQIKALNGLIKNDNPKDAQIHIEALDGLEEALKAFETIKNRVLPTLYSKTEYCFNYSYWHLHTNHALLIF